MPKSGDRSKRTSTLPLPSLCRAEPLLHVVEARNKRVKMDLDP